MPLSDQFKRVVVALFRSKQLKNLGEKKRSIAAVDIARSNLVNSGFLTRQSLTAPITEMKETSKGKKASRDKRRDKDHARKMKEFDRIWQVYLETRSEESGDTPR